MKPDVSIPVKVGKTYDAPERGGTITELHVPVAEWGKLQAIIIREAVNQL